MYNPDVSLNKLAGKMEEFVVEMLERIGNMRKEVKLFEGTIAIGRNGASVKVDYDIPLKRVYVSFDSFINRKYKSSGFWFPPPPTKPPLPRRKYIVCNNYVNGKRFAEDSGFNPQECIYFNTSLDTTCLRGMIIDPINLYYAEGWYTGKNAQEFLQELKYIIKKGTER